MRLLQSKSTLKPDIAIFALWEGEALPKEVTSTDVAEDFSGKDTEQVIVYTGQKPSRVLLVGLGKPVAETFFRNRRLRIAAARINKALSTHHLASASMANLNETDALTLAEALLQADYRYRAFTPKKASEETRLDWLAIEGIKQAKLDQLNSINQAQSWARDLVNHPSNHITPRHFVSHIQALKGKRISVKILGKKELLSEKMGLILGVAQGSSEEPYLAIGEYKPARATNKQPYVFVGKGVTFDTGGLNIKPTDGMGDMKIDMAGAAAAFGALKAAATLKLPYWVVTIAPLVENMVSGSSVKPGDILTSAAGLTVEIDNTDAEGRLVLADALHYARRYKPAMIIDLATLTGACMVALGLDTTGSFSRDIKLAESFRTIGDPLGEYVWPLPMDSRHEEYIRSQVADIGNNKCPRGRIGGATEGAVFLSKFVDEATPWVHLDIAGPSYYDAAREQFTEPGATGYGVRLLVKWLQSQS